VTRTQKIVLVLLLIGAVAGVCGLGTVLDYQRYSGDIVEELTYFPSGRFLRIASLGYQALASDLLWLKGIQYYGEHRRGDKYYPLADHIFSTVTDLDPRFLGAYRFGAFVLAQDMGQPALGVRLLKKGMVSNPGSWQLPFDLGFLYFTSADDAKAAHFFRMASQLEDSPEIARRFSAFAYRRAGRADVALSLWEEIYRSSTNSVIKESALYSIKSIRRDQIGETITGLVEAFNAKRGRFPHGLRDLVDAGLIDVIPGDPFGGAYFFDPTSRRVLCTTAVEEEAQRTRDYLERKARQYHDEAGHFPTSISELVSEGLIDRVPDVTGASLHYDASDGGVHYVYSWEEQG
jgi:tetratricopeptide (TPR) repeat protein